MARSVVVAVIILLAAAASGAAQSVAVKVAIEPITPPVEGNVGYFYVTLENTTDLLLAYADLRVHVDTPVVDAVVAGDPANPWQCEGESPLWVACGSSNPPFDISLAPRQSLRFRFFLRPANYGRFTLGAYVTWRGEDGTYRRSEEVSRAESLVKTLRVTKGDDSGPGSLRQVIGDVDETCVPARIPCAIVVDDGVQTVRPLAPLPPIGLDVSGSLMDLTVDGAGVGLDGSGLASGSGITVLGRGFLRITGMSVAHFPDYGLDLQFFGTSGGGSSVEENSIAMNGRGIHLRGGGLDIRGNTVTANARSGVFIEGAGDFVLRDNQIRSNGASGVYCGPHTGGRLAGNHIDGNREFGVALDATAGTLIDENVIRDNGLLPIDVGLDGFSGYAFHDTPMTEAFVPPPHLLHAEFDPASGATRISGTWVVTDGWTVVYVYANGRPVAQGERFVGKTYVHGGTFTVTVPEDLRGAFVAAYVQHGLSDWSGGYSRTSEFSDDVVQVPPGPRRRAVATR